MNRKLLAIAVVAILAVAGLWLWKRGDLKLPSLAPAGWSKSYGGAQDEEFNSVLLLDGGDYLVAGGVSSFGAGRQDAWLMKLDPAGQPLWQKAYGGPEDEEALSLQKTADGNFIMTARVESFGAGGMDLWVLKLDPAGQPLWQETIGGKDWDYAPALKPLAQGGYLVAGGSGSWRAGNNDLWVLKLDEQGKIVWQKTYGSDQWDYAAAVLPLADGGCVVVGGTQSFGAKDFDGWALKLDPHGQVLWQKMIGGDKEDRFYAILLTADQNYLIAGATASFGAGSSDVWVVKLNPAGQILWQKTYGGKSEDKAFSIQAVSDGGYLVLAHSQSFGPGASDAWLLKLDANGQLWWQKNYGSKHVDRIYASQETPDRGFIVAGGSNSFGAGQADGWLFKLDRDGNMSKDCPAGVSGAALGNSDAKVQDTNAVPTDSQAVVIASTVKPIPTDAVIHSQCPPEKSVKVEAAKKPKLPAPAPGQKAGGTP